MIDNTIAVEHVFTGVPTFFRACAASAAGGRPYNYYFAGREFGRHLAGKLVPYSASDAEWRVEVEDFAFLGRHHRRTALAWLDKHYPRCMELVPRRRRARFVDGVVAMCDEGW